MSEGLTGGERPDSGELPDPSDAPLFPPHLSPSQINSLLTCGEQYRLQRVVRVPARPMWAGVGGTVVHRLTEELDREHFARMKGIEDAADADPS